MQQSEPFSVIVSLPQNLQDSEEIARLREEVSSLRAQLQRPGSPRREKIDGGSGTDDQVMMAYTARFSAVRIINVSQRARCVQEKPTLYCQNELTSVITQTVPLECTHGELSFE